MVIWMSKKIKKIILLCIVGCLFCSCGTAKTAESEDVKPAAAEKEQEAEAGKEKPAAAEKKQEAEAGKEKPAAAKKEQEGEAGKEKPATAEKEQEAETGKEKPAAAEKKQEAEAEKEKPAAAKKEQETEAEKKDSAQPPDSEGGQASEDVGEITVFEQPRVMYASAAVNVRRGPGTEYEVVSSLAAAQQVEVTGQAQTQWFQIMLDGEPAYVSNRYLSETETAPESQETVSAPQKAIEPSAASAPAGVIMVGDSRCVQMQEAVEGGGCTWICENSKEYTWFVDKAIPRIDNCVGEGSKVVINMGVNDPEHYRQYAETINNKAAEWAQLGAQTYLVSVNPVWENPYTTKEQVETFNENVPGLLSGVTWIDTCSWLETNGYRILDGLHYDAPTYVNIFNLIMGSIGG